MLHIDLFALVAGKRKIESGQYALFLPVTQFILIKKVGFDIAVAKKQPGFTLRLAPLTLL